MMIKSILGFVSKREWAAWGILVAGFVAFLAWHVNVWAFIALAVLFVGYVSWTTSAFFVTQGDLRGKAIAALALPVCLAIFKAAICLGVAWLIRWCAGRLFGI